MSENRHTFALPGERVVECDDWYEVYDDARAERIRNGTASAPEIASGPGPVYVLKRPMRLPAPRELIARIEKGNP